MAIHNITLDCYDNVQQGNNIFLDETACSIKSFFFFSCYSTYFYHFTTPWLYLYTYTEVAWLMSNSPHLLLKARSSCLFCRHRVSKKRCLKDYFSAIFLDWLMCIGRAGRYCPKVHFDTLLHNIMLAVVHRRYLWCFQWLIFGCPKAKKPLRSRLKSKSA